VKSRIDFIKKLIDSIDYIDFFDQSKMTCFLNANINITINTEINI